MSGRPIKRTLRGQGQQRPWSTRPFLAVDSKRFRPQRRYKKRAGLSLESPARELTVRNRRLLVLVLGCRLGRLRYVLCIHRERVEHLVPALLRPDHVALRRRVVPVRG